MPPVVHRDIGFRRMFLPAFRRDMELVETYAPRNRDPIRIPITAIGGTDDDHPTSAQLDDWIAYSSAGFNKKTFPGGHFFLRSEEAALVRFIDSTLALERKGTE